MIIQCPECQSRYLVPDQSIGATGRTVRCANCSHSWFQAPTPESTKAVMDELDKMLDQINVAPKKMRAGSNLPTVKKAKVSILLKLSTLLAISASAAAAVVLMMPQWVGLPRSQALMLDEIALVKELSDKHSYYQLSGKIVNSSDTTKTIPTLRITLVDDEGTSLQYWSFNGDIKTVEAGKSVPFATGNLDMRFAKGTRLVVDIGNPLELNLRRKPAPPTTDKTPPPTDTTKAPS